MQNEAKFLTIAQAAQFLNVSNDTLRRWEKKGFLTPQRTKGGVRRYTLLDLKIAKLNKRKNRFFQLPSLIKQNYLNSKRDLKIVFLTSALWIFGIFIYNFLSPIFVMPTSPEQQILSDQLKQPTQLKLVSETTPLKTTTYILVIKDKIPANQSTTAVSLGSDLLIYGSEDSLHYTETLTKYYSLQPLPENHNNTIIKRI